MGKVSHSSRPSDKGRGGGWSKNYIFRPFGPQFGLNIRAGASQGPLLDLPLKGPCKSPCYLQLLSNGYRQEKCDNCLLMSKAKAWLNSSLFWSLFQLFLTCISRINKEKKDLSLRVIWKKKKKRDHYTFLGNCTHNPPLSQYYHLQMYLSL